MTKKKCSVLNKRHTGKQQLICMYSKYCPRNITKLLLREYIAQSDGSKTAVAMHWLFNMLTKGRTVR